jgi:hypothetical protein
MAAMQLPITLTDCYEQRALGKYYDERKAIAISYLMAMGAKALSLVAIGNGSSNGFVINQGINAEAALAHTIACDKFRLILINGLWVCKKARNGWLRSTLVSLKTNKGGDDYFEWPSKSFFSGNKKGFVLKTLRRCSLVACEDAKSRAQSSAYSREDGNSDGSRLTTPYVSLLNDMRQLDLRFSNEELTVLFLDFINHCYLQRP